jgi:hypothetical protein
MPAWLTIQQWLQDGLHHLRLDNPAFSDVTQASKVLELVWLDVLPAYLDFHNELLFHHEPEGIFTGFFLCRVVESVLQQGEPWEDKDRIVDGALQHLNDFVGFRPVAVLEGRKITPYSHEFLRPIPVFIRGAGVTFGTYHELIRRALDILSGMPEEILNAAYFDPNLLQELALDPRSYDFDHPVNKRPNYHFGQWDPNSVTNDGYYHRFVIQQVTVDGLLARLEDDKHLPRQELLHESAAVLAGTMLMASGISGWGPGTFASTVSLGDLMKPIAETRDQFYSHLLDSMEGPHADRLRDEAKIRRQPFGGVRQHLNAQLARKRASQLEHVLLARLYARMGSPSAARDQTDSVDVPAARILCQIDCLLTSGNQALRRGDLNEAVEVPSAVRALLLKGIECGAIVDPWNILGFAGNFARFTGPDSAVHDHRVDELIHIMELLFSFLSRLWREAAAQNNSTISNRIELEFQSLATWWQKYAAYEVDDLDATDPAISLESARLVAHALRLWHQGGASAGDIKFWAPHANIFDSPKAYALVIEALLERGDFVASMALLVHWLSQASEVGLQSGQISFSDIARDWLYTLQRTSRTPVGDDLTIEAKWQHIQKFFDYLEANGEELCGPPVFRLGQAKNGKDNSGEMQATGLDWDEDAADDAGDDASPFSAAYEDVVYEDSTDDGVDGSIFEEESDSQDELLAEGRRLSEHLNFQSAMAVMWKQVALAPRLFADNSNEYQERQVEAMHQWCATANKNRLGLLALVESIQQYRVPRGGSDQDSMGRYDRKRLVKESLLEDTIAAAIEASDARRMLLSAIAAIGGKEEILENEADLLPEEDRLAVQLFGRLMSGQREDVEELFSKYITILRGKKLLYLPLARRGSPQDIFFVRLRRRVITHLLTWLPRQGFYYQACQLVDTARFMEHQHPVGAGAVTEFDELFQMAYKSIVGSVLRSAFAWQANSDSDAADRKLPHEAATAFPLSVALGIDPLSEWTDLEDLVDSQQPEPDSDTIIPILEQLTEVLLGSWLSHSRTLRLSILETVDSDRQWKSLVEFIENYGAGLLTQNFLKLGNVRAILHQGVQSWLQQSMLDDDNEGLAPLISAIERGRIRIEDAQHSLTIVLEAIVDHYSEYRDYNSTTTQSDRGEMLYMLLDFLRLRVRYDRVSWNLKPVFWAHEVLVRNACPKTATAWRRALAERIARESEHYIQELHKLQEKYAMRMPTIADRLEERFIKPMTIDRMRALIRPSMRQLASSPPSSPYPKSFEQLIQEAGLLTQNPTGVGLDIPVWLLALEEEVADVQEEQRTRQRKPANLLAVANRILSSNDITSQLFAASQKNRMLK